MKKHLIAAALAVALSPAAVLAQDGSGAVQPGTAATRSVLQGCYTYAAAPSPVTGQQMAVPCPGTPGAASSGTVAGQTPFSGGVALTVTASAYSVGYSFGGLQTLSLAQTNGGPFSIGGLELRSASAMSTSLWVYAWTKSPSATCTDHTPFAASASDNLYLLPGFPLALQFGVAPVTGDAATYAGATNLNAAAMNTDISSTENVYLCVVNNSSTGSTPGSTVDLSLTYNGWH